MLNKWPSLDRSALERNPALWTPRSYGQFALSLGKKAYPLNTGRDISPQHVMPPHFQIRSYGPVQYVCLSLRRTYSRTVHINVS